MYFDIDVPCTLLQPWCLVEAGMPRHAEKNPQHAIRNEIISPRPRSKIPTVTAYGGEDTDVLIVIAEDWMCKEPIQTCLGMYSKERKPDELQIWGSSTPHVARAPLRSADFRFGKQLETSGSLSALPSTRLTIFYVTAMFDKSWETALSNLQHAGSGMLTTDAHRSAPHCAESALLLGV